MNTSPLPYKQVLFVCTNARKAGERVSCAGEGRCGEELLQKLKSYVKINHLDDRVRVAKSGCHEKCEIGPNIIALPQNEIVSHVGVEDFNSIVKTYLEPLI